MVARLTKNVFRRLGDWVGGRLVDDVPSDIAACEFDCSKERCEGQDLIGCERRQRAAAAAREFVAATAADADLRSPRNGQVDAQPPVAAKPAA